MQCLLIFFCIIIFLILWKSLSCMYLTCSYAKDNPIAAPMATNPSTIDSLLPA